MRDMQRRVRQGSMNTQPDPDIAKYCDLMEEIKCG